jgi:flagella basal body P-ring formation protein FlgA
MKPILPLLIACALAGGAQAESLVATRTLPARSVLSEADIELVAQDYPGAASDPALVIGLETSVALYKGRPILIRQLGEPAIVERNGAVTLAYQTGGLMIITEGRALARGAAGDSIRVMNLASRTTLTGRIGADGTVYVTP